MNPKEQHERRTAVEQVRKRQDDLECVVEALAKDIVIERQLRIDAVKGTRACCDARASEHDDTTLRTYERIAGIEKREADRLVVIGPGLGGRLRFVGRCVRWFLTGRSIR